jgi:carbamoyltransferase
VIHAADGMQGTLLGPSFDDAEIMQRLDRLSARYQPLDEATLIEHAALADGKVIGWFQGRMEFGAHSILGDPRRPTR